MRLIDADALLEVLRNSHESHATNSREESLLNRDIRLVKEQAKYHPIIIEARPHGEWEMYGEKVEAYDISGIKTWGQKRQCTNCGFLKIYIEDFGFYSICPNCGASMSANDRQVTGKLNSEIEKSNSEIVPDYRDG